MSGVFFLVSNLLVTKASRTCIIQDERRPPMFLCRHCLVLYRLCRPRLATVDDVASQCHIIDFELPIRTYMTKKYNNVMKVLCVIENIISFSGYFSIPPSLMAALLTLITTL